jgi:hypothetical protein
MSDYSAEYHHIRDRDGKAEALRQRQLQNQQTLMRLENRNDRVIQNQSIQKSPTQNIQRVPMEKQVAQNPSFLKRAVMPTPMKAVPQPRAASTQPYAPKIQKYPLKNTPSILYAGGLPTGMPVKKWPTSFKKAFHKPTSDETILKGLQNLDNMSKELLGKSGR